MPGQRRKNLIGKRFGRLVVIKADHVYRNRAFWLCKCDCGKTTVTSTAILTMGDSVSCGCYAKEIIANRQVIDLTGIRFGRLTVIKETVCPRNTKDRSRYWLCKCDCGNEHITSSTNLRKGCTKSCGCLQREGAQIANGENSFNTLYKRYAINAKNRNLEFCLSKEEFREITQTNCFYCGTPPKQVVIIHKRHNGEYLYNGIDRLDNAKGYTKSNTVACCGICNYAKRTRSIEDFLAWVERIYNHTHSSEFLRPIW